MAEPETLRIKCPSLNCQKILAVPASARGKTVRCRGCGSNIRVPAAPAAPSAPPADKSATPGKP